MSSSKLHEFSSMLGTQSGKRFVVQIGREALAAYIEKERTTRGWSFGEIVRRSGDYIKSSSTLGNIVNGNVEEVTENTMRGLGKAFDVPVTQIFELYYGTERFTPELGNGGPIDFQQLPNGDLLIRITPLPIRLGHSSTSQSELEARQKRRELLLWMFDDVPEECQLDILASVAGVHTRRSLSARIHERHEARASARNIIEEKFTERDSTRSDPVRKHPAVTDTPRDVPLPETTPEDLGEEEESDDARPSRGIATGKNGTEN